MEEYLKLYDQGINLIDEKNYTEAISILTSAINRKDDFEKALLQRAICYRQLLRPKSALADLDQVVKMNNQNSRAYFERGLNYVQLKDFRTASYEFDNAFKYDAQNVDAALWKSVAMKHLKEYPNAVVAINQAIKIQPDNLSLYLRRSDYYRYLGKKDKMIQNVNYVLEKDPENIAAHLIRGIDYCTNNQVIIGMKDFEDVLKLDSDNQFAQVMVGEITVSMLNKDIDFNKYLAEIDKLMPPLPYQNPSKPVIKDKQVEQKADEQHGEVQLEKTVGLKMVKQQLDSYLSVWKINQELARRGMPQTPTPYTLLFSGNRGSGQKLVAQGLSSRLYQMKLINSDHFIMVTPKNLISAYPGQSGEKTDYVLDKAKDGVLLIKNIDSLLDYKDNNSYVEVLDRLQVRAMDEDDPMMIIISDTPKNVQHFLDKMDFDFRSRFNHLIQFADYTNDELLELLDVIIKKQNKHFDDPETKRYLVQQVHHYLLTHNHAEIGNANFIQTLVNMLSSNQSLRLAKLDLKELDDEDFSELTIVDVKTTLLKMHIISVTPIDQGIHSATDQLNAMIGLTSVKEQIRKYVANAVIDKKMGKLQADLTNMNMVFAGSAGTGKTTVARLFSQIMYENGILKTNHCNEVSARDLVASYVGQTAPKTHQQVMKSLGGVLFIDEAYALLPSTGGNDFNREAVDQLVKDMEDYKENIIVILAGYTQPMRHFLDNANPGLRSRFNHWIEFPNYNDDEMLNILDYQLNQRDLRFEDDDTRQLISKSLIVILHNTDSEKLGNARFIRQVVANLIENKNVRLVDEIDKPDFDQSRLAVINRSDVEKTFADLNKEYLQGH